VIKVRTILTILIVLTVLPFPLAAQNKDRFEENAKTRSIQDRISFSLHSVKANNESTRIISNALDLSNPSLMFQTSERILFQYITSFDSYVYIINSSSNITSLQYPARNEDNIKIPRNTLREFQFLISGAPGTEEFIILVSRVLIENVNVRKLLNSIDRALPEGTRLPSHSSKRIPET
jgi:hypothetical protein